MFWKKNREITILKEEINKENMTKIIENKAKTNGVTLPIPPQDISTRWAMYAFTDGIEQGLNEFQTASFSNAVSMMMTGISCSSSTEYYFYEEKIDSILIGFYEDIQELYDLEEEQQKELYYYIRNWYVCNIEQYEKKVFRHQPCANNEIKTVLTEKEALPITIRRLLHNDLNLTEITNYHTDNTVQLDFSLGISDERTYNNLDGETDTDKLLTLLKRSIN